MPFTLSHIAFCLPLLKLCTRLSITGLVIGSILPDIEYYLRMQMYGTWGNSLYGILLYEIPIGIFIAFTFHLVVRDLLIIHAPEIIKRKWSFLLNFDWSVYLKNHKLIFIISLLLGIGTHLLWDLFSHGSFYIFGVSIPFLEYEIGGHPFHVWNQMILSIIGLLLLGLVLLKGGKLDNTTIQNVSRSDKVRYWGLILTVTFLTYSIRVLVGVPEEKVIIQHMVFITSAFFIGLLIVSLIYKTRLRIKKSTS